MRQRYPTPTERHGKQPRQDDDTCIDKESRDRLERGPVLTMLSVVPLPAAGVASAVTVARSSARPVHGALDVRGGGIRIKRLRKSRFH